MRKRNILLLSLMVLTIAILASIGIGNQSNYTWISDMVSRETHLVTSSTSIVAYVNETPIYKNEVDRCVLNIRVLNEIEKKKLETKFFNGNLKKQELDSMISLLEERIQAIDLFDHVTKTLINDEIYYQVALQLGYKPNLEDAALYEKQAFEGYEKDHQLILTAVSEGYGLTYSEYIEEFLISVRIKKWAKVYLDNHILESLKLGNKYQDLPVEELRTLPEYLETLEHNLSRITVTMSNVR